MSASAGNAEKSRFYAGIYMRMRGRTLFWGWEKPSISAVAEPVTTVGDWLRMAHLLLDRDDDGLKLETASAVAKFASHDKTAQ